MLNRKNPSFALVLFIILLKFENVDKCFFNYCLKIFLLVLTSLKMRETFKTNQFFVDKTKSSAYIPPCFSYNNLVPLYLWWTKVALKCESVYKYFFHDCFYDIRFCTWKKSIFIVIWLFTWFILLCKIREFLIKATNLGRLLSFSWNQMP